MKSISILNMKGGVAKTTIAVNFADYLASREGHKVLLIDIDPQYNATQCLISAKDYSDHIDGHGSTIVDVFRAFSTSVTKGGNVSTKRKIKLINIKQNYDLLPGSLNLYKIEMASGSGKERKLASYIKSIKEQYDYIIIDTPPTPSVWMTSALIASNYYFIPVKPDKISLTGIDLFRNFLLDKVENYELDITCLGVMLSIVEQQTLIYQESKKYLSTNKIWKDYLFESILPKRVIVPRKQYENQLILDFNIPDLSSAITNISKELLNRISEHEKTKAG